MGPWVLDHPDSPFSKNYKAGAGNVGLVIQGACLAAAWPIFVLGVLVFGLVKPKPGPDEGVGSASGG